MAKNLFQMSPEELQAYVEGMQGDPQAGSQAPEFPVRGPANKAGFINQVAQRQNTTAPSLATEKLRLRGLLGQQAEGVSQLEDLANQTREMPTQMDLSPLMALAEKESGIPLSKNYKPFTAEDKFNRLTALRKLATEEQGNLAKEQLGLVSGEGKNDMATLAILAKMFGQEGKGGFGPKDLYRMKVSLGNDLSSGYTKARSAIGMIGNTQIRASRMATLLDSFASGNELDTRDMRDLATGMAAMIGTGTGQIPLEQLEALDPRWGGRILKFVQEWTTGKPVPLEAREFVDKFARIIKREQKSSSEQLLDLNRKFLSKYSDLYDTSPKDVYLQAGKWGITKKQVDEAFSPDTEEQILRNRELPYAEEPGGVYSTAEAGLIGAAPKVVIQRPPQVPEAEWNVLSPAGQKAVSDKFKSKAR